MPVGVTSIIVVPVPCRLLELLKLDTRASPGLALPPLGKFDGTYATPYGFKSPFTAGTVETARTKVRLLRIEVGAGSEFRGVWIATAFWWDHKLRSWNALSSSRDSRASQTGCIVPDYHGFRGDDQMFR